jgi:isocitrate/isopropylmalate dehydrogenase
MKITLITGDGIGPEIADAPRRCIDATGTDINWEIGKTDKLEKAAASVIAEGKDVTYDMKPNRDDPTGLSKK